MKITVRVFFRSITLRNRESIPQKGPLMVLANHPSTFMDPLVIATILDREVYFLAKGELFKNKLVAWLFSTLNMIPVYRKQDDPNQMVKNQETFDKCYEHLERGGAILMFPEGTSITERKLRPIKTGAARIVLGAEAGNNFKLNSQIITIGLNYADPHKFNKDLFINIGTPIKAIDYQTDYSNDSFTGARKLTEDIRLQLENLIIGVNDEQAAVLVNDLEMLYKRKLSGSLNLPVNDKNADFILTKNIVEAVNHYLLHDPMKVEKMRTRIKDYLNKLSELGLSDADLEINKHGASMIKNSLKAILTIVLGFPFYIYGLVNNILAFEIPSLIAKKATKTIEYRGALGMLLGMFSFLIFYTLQIRWVGEFTGSVILTLIYAVSLPLTGLFAYWYYHTIKRIRAKWLFMMVFYRKSVLISNLIVEREQIIAELDKIRSEYEIVYQNKIVV